MVKNVTMSHSTLYTGFLLVITINALKSATAVRAHKRICVIPMQLVLNFTNACSHGAFGFFVAFRISYGVGDE